jgi:hypothetical protein
LKFNFIGAKMRYKYNGEVTNILQLQGPCLTIRVPKKDGTYTVLNAPGPGGFVIGADLGFDFTDVRSIRVMNADPRFSAI